MLVDIIAFVKRINGHFMLGFSFVSFPFPGRFTVFVSHPFMHVSVLW